MDDRQLGAAFRRLRIQARLRQVDVARDSGVPRTAIIDVEAGRLDRVAVGALRRVADRLGIRLELAAGWRGADLDRLLATGHARMHELVAALFAREVGWVTLPEVSYSIYGERGVIDLIAWHAGTRSLLIIELKTALGDPQQLVATMDRRVRLASRIVEDRGWRPSTVSAWVVVADTSTNRRRVAAHQGLLRARFPHDGRQVRGWLSTPSGTLLALSFLADVAAANVTRLIAPVRRVRPARDKRRERI